MWLCCPLVEIRRGTVGQCGSRWASRKWSKAGTKACRACALERRGSWSYLLLWPMERKGKVPYCLYPDACRRHCMLTYRCMALSPQKSFSFSKMSTLLCIYVLSVPLCLVLNGLLGLPHWMKVSFSSISPLILNMEHVIDAMLCPGKHKPP